VKEHGANQKDDERPIFEGREGTGGFRPVLAVVRPARYFVVNFSRSNGGQFP